MISVQVIMYSYAILALSVKLFLRFIYGLFAIDEKLSTKSIQEASHFFSAKAYFKRK